MIFTSKSNEISPHICLVGGYQKGKIYEEKGKVIHCWWKYKMSIAIMCTAIIKKNNIVVP